MNDFKLKLPIELNAVNTHFKQPPISRPEGALFHQFIWVKGGVGVFKIRDESLVLAAGQGLFMRAGVPCSYSGESFYTAWCSFFTTEHLVDYVLGEREYILFDTPDYLDGATEELTLIASGNTTSLALSAAAYSYITELFSAITEKKEDTVAKVRDFLYKNYASPLSLEEIATAVGLDRFSLCRLFKERAGTSVMRELCRVRISKAKRLLRYTSEPIEAIGRLSGFDGHSYFTKRFSELVGCTPREYRRRFYTTGE